MSRKKALQWNVASLSEPEREELITNIAEEVDGDVAFITDDDEIAELKNAITEVESVRTPETKEGPQFIEGGNPEFIIISLKTVIVLLETGIASMKIYDIYNALEEDENQQVVIVSEDEVPSLLEEN